MYQIITATHVPTGNTHEFTIDQWRSRVGLVDESGNKLFKFEGATTVQAPATQKTARTLSSGTATTTKKRGCGCKK